MHATRSPHRGLAGLAVLLALAGSATACGNDDDDEPAPAPATAAASDTAEEALDAVGDDALVETLGKALVISLPGATGYVVDGEVVTVEIDGESGETSASLCAIANAARDGVDAPAEIALAFSDDTVDCRR